MDVSLGIHLRRSEPRTAAIRAALERGGSAAGLAGVLGDLNRTARRTRVPGRAPTWGFAWNEQDGDSTTWWPQGISTSADAAPDAQVDGRRIVVVTWYSHTDQGSRLTFVDLDTLTYRHVLVVRTTKDGFAPLKIHAGGVVWAGSHLHLAGTARGLFTCHVDDIMRVAPTDATFDYRYVLPVRFAYQAGSADHVEGLRYSFLSLDRQADPPLLVAGEYGRKGQTQRLVRYPLDPETFELARDPEGSSYPLNLHDGINNMQGAAVVGDDYYVTQSRGRFRLGYLYVGRPGSTFRPRRWALPPGPEDISYWPQEDQFWSLSEYPGRRFVFAMDRDHLRTLPRLRGAIPS